MVSVKCPKCSASFSAEPDGHGFLACPTCGAKLHSQLPPAGGKSAPDVDKLAQEMRDIRRLVGEVLQYQAQVLALLKSWPPQPATATQPPGSAASHAEVVVEAQAAESPEPSAPVAEPRPLPRIRQRRKTVLLVDDDPQARQEAQAALDTAQVPMRIATDGNAALKALAEEKPDVLVLELAIGEPMPGKDLVNYIKATMEWVDVPIVLYTRLPIANQREARTMHGADEVVLKGPGSPEALLNRVIQVFQRG
jgi:CheY-like chemotaxis protein